MEWLTTLMQALQDPANYVNALTLGAIYALIAVGYTMVYGIIKLINFAHGEVIMLGAYVGLLCVTHFNAPLVLAISTLSRCSISAGPPNHGVLALGAAVMLSPLKPEIGIAVKLSIPASSAKA